MSGYLASGVGNLSASSNVPQNHLLEGAVTMRPNLMGTIIREVLLSSCQDSNDFITVTI